MIPSEEAVKKVLKNHRVKFHPGGWDCTCGDMGNYIASILPEWTYDDHLSSKIVEELRELGFSVMRQVEEDYCGACVTCINEEKSVSGLPYSAMFMVVCSQCGNKRCPKALWHRYKCTGSNETDQTFEVESTWK